MSIELNTVSVAGEDGDDSEAIEAPARELQYAALVPAPHIDRGQCRLRRDVLFDVTWSGHEVE